MWYVRSDGGVSDYVDSGIGVSHSYGRTISPATVFPSYACFVNPDGDVYYYVDNIYDSYGLNSPNTHNSGYAWYVTSTGYVREYGINSVDGSYGYILIHIRVYFLASITIL